MYSEGNSQQGPNLGLGRVDGGPRAKPGDPGAREPTSTTSVAGSSRFANLPLTEVFLRGKPTVSRPAMGAQEEAGRKGAVLFSVSILRNRRYPTKGRQ